MKNKIAFVAVGQAGGNIGQLFEDRGRPRPYFGGGPGPVACNGPCRFNAKYHQFVE